MVGQKNQLKSLEMVNGMQKKNSYHIFKILSMIFKQMCPIGLIMNILMGNGTLD